MSESGTSKTYYIQPQLNVPHEVSEVMCVKCLKRWISVRPESTLLKEIECPNCGTGYVIMTGQKLLEWE